MENKCWICGRTREEVNEYVDDSSWDKEDKTDGYLEVPSYEPNKKQNLHCSFLKKGTKIRICDICWALLQMNFEHELVKVKKAIQEAIPKGFADEIIEQLEYYGFESRYEP